MPNAIAFAPLLFTLQFLIYHARRRRVKRFLIGRGIKAREAMPAQFARNCAGYIMVDFTGHPVTSRIKVKPITLDHMVSSKRMERLVIIKFLLVGRMIHPREVIGREDHWRRRHRGRASPNIGARNASPFETVTLELAIITGERISQRKHNAINRMRPAWVLNIPLAVLHDQRNLFIVLLCEHGLSLLG
jgi:hypothetical protein